MSKISKYFLIGFLLMSSLAGYTQSTVSEVDTAEIYARFREKITVKTFSEKKLREILLFQLNKQREFRYNLDALMVDSIMRKAAADQAVFMANYEDDEIKKSGKRGPTYKRLKYYGGSGKGKELVYKTPIAKGKNEYCYKEVADQILYKWFNNKKTLSVLKDQKYLFAGIGAQLDERGKKVYVSLVLGNYNSFNSGAHKRKEMEVPYSKRKYGVKPYDERTCRRCEKYKNIHELQKGLYVEKGVIYFKTENYREFKRLIRKPKDGLAVDIIQPEQFKCGSENITDNSLYSRGVLTKRLWSKKIYKKNQVNAKKSNAVLVKMGKLPKGLGSDYELNLVVIQEKHFCKNLSPTYVEKAGVEYEDALELLADTVTTLETEYVPRATSTRLQFKIPFEVSKSNYKQEDIEPFLEALNEPDFVINELDITAYSSVEGTDEENRALQERRAQSIVKAFKLTQNADIITKIEKGYNFDEFVKDIGSTDYAEMADMSISEVQDYIREKGLHKVLEPILKNHRYAKIEMQITYNIEGDKEQPYVLKMFNNSIESNDLQQALSIQKYIFKKVLSGDYDKQAVYEQKIPDKPEYAGLQLNKLWLSGLLMNKLWLEKYIQDGDLQEEYCGRIGHFHEMAPENIYIYYNYLYCRILNDPLGDERDMDKFQRNIDDLYDSELSKGTVDALNLKYQFKIIEALDTLDTPHPKLFESLDRIKEIVNIKEASWLNSLKLAYVFMEQQDYKFAVKLLEPFIDEEFVFEELLFTYLSLCSYFPEKMYTNRFVRAMERVKNDYSDRFCEFFEGEKFSIQVLGNPKVKEMYCKTCKK